MSKAGFSKKPRVFIPKCRKGDNPPQFTIRRLDPLEVFDVMEVHGLAEDSFDETGAPRKGLLSVARSLRVAYDYLKAGVVGWSNVSDEDGEEIPFSIENMRCLDIEVVMELSAAVQGAVQEDEAKNSSTPSA